MKKVVVELIITKELEVEDDLANNELLSYLDYPNVEDWEIINGEVWDVTE